MGGGRYGDAMLEALVTESRRINALDDPAAGTAEKFYDWAIADALSTHPYGACGRCTVGGRQQCSICCLSISPVCVPPTPTN